ncbi:MAG TPA: ribosome-associated translation inhibitor RaiA, partial [Acidobacteriaceae bacterium]|nr:ribosome-associated translation inhibitor RaiA [Acidobacteriaceae bacterium]
MIVEYTGRHFEVTQKYKAKSEAGLKAVETILGGITDAKVILTVDKYRQIAEVAVSQGGHTLVATCEAAEMMTALHDALAKIEQQAVRHRQKTTATMRHPRSLDKGASVDGPEAAAALG